MAKRKSRKNRVPSLSFRPHLGEGVGREIVAVLLVALAFVLVFAMFDFGGSLAVSMFKGLRYLFGFGAFLIPLLFLLLAFMIFQPAKYEVQAHNYIGFTGFLVTLAGLMHIGVDVERQIDAQRQFAHIFQRGSEEWKVIP